MTTAPYSVTAAAGLPETQLPADLVDRLPASVAAAPWRTACTITTWWHAPTRRTLELLPDALRPQRLSVVAWSLVTYSDTPVGPYRELVAAAVPRGRGRVHIPFIVVDSLPSIVGGRANWLLPKALARFDDAEATVTVTAAEPATPAWTVSVTARPIGPPLPFVVRFGVDQCTTTGEVRRFASTMRGLGRYARVTVSGQADGPLSGMLRTGRHHGAVIRHTRFNALPLESRNSDDR